MNFEIRFTQNILLVKNNDRIFNYELLMLIQVKVMCCNIWLKYIDMSL